MFGNVFGDEFDDVLRSYSWGCMNKIIQSRREVCFG